MVSTKTLQLYAQESEPVHILHDAQWVTGPVSTDPENLSTILLRIPNHPNHSESTTTLSSEYQPKSQLTSSHKATSYFSYGHHILYYSSTLQQVSVNSLQTFRESQVENG
jgi:hypothetical protein